MNPGRAMPAISRRWLSRFALALAVALGSAASRAQPQEAVLWDARLDSLTAAFVTEIDRRLEVPGAEQIRYASLLAQTFADAGVTLQRPQWVVLVDRSAWVQAVMLWWVAPNAGARLIGASPASTGRPSGFDHFDTPTGVFEHGLDNLDFRAEGTLNELGIRGYGDQGMRVYDFGWVTARRGWAPGSQPMRLQMHATDRDRLEPRLGRRESKGCIRIPASLNAWFDHHGVLDAAYEEAMVEGRHFWVLHPDREATPWSGRYLVVVETSRPGRPDWSPWPRVAQRAATAPRRGSPSSR